MPERSPEAWRDDLSADLATRWSRMRVFDAYYEGRQQLAFMTQKFRDIYGDLFADLSDNWMRIVVDASVERLRVQGFRFGDSQEDDDDAWAIWQANGLDGVANQIHTEAVKLGVAYWLVQPGLERAQVTGEHPSQVIVATSPGDRRTREAALKRWSDGSWIYANVYLPDAVHKYRSSAEAHGLFGVAAEDAWRKIETVPNPLGVVPVVEVPNNPSMLYGGTSDLAAGPIRIQDAINKLLCDLLVGSEFDAMPQRVLLGVEQPKDADGRPVPLNKIDQAAAGSRLWMFPGEHAKAVEFSAAELSNIRESIDGLVRDLTAQTRTPPHYVSGQIVNASGDALKAAETGLVAKVRDKMDPFGEAHEEMMRLAFRAQDRTDPRAEAIDAEVIWRDPESRSQAETVDAIQKQVAMGLPFEVALEKMGYSPQEIDRILALQGADELIAATLPPPIPTAEANGQPEALPSPN